MELNNTEKMILRGLEAREREIQRNFISPLQEDVQTFFHMIEKRLKLDTGSIGTTHTLDTTAGCINIARPDVSE